MKIFQLFDIVLAVLRKDLIIMLKKQTSPETAPLSWPRQKIPEF